jgi:hypothetical protein
MNIRRILELINRMETDSVIDRYAIGGAVGATFYLEPVATIDVDVFVAFRTSPDRLILDPAPIFDYLTARGGVPEGEYIRIGDWPVQFIPASGPLLEEALAQAVKIDVEGTMARVFSAEHLAAIALQTGRARDKARLLQFLEAGVLDAERFQAVLTRHGLGEAWKCFESQFLKDGP